MEEKADYAPTFGQDGVFHRRHSETLCDLYECLDARVFAHSDVPSTGVQKRSDRYVHRGKGENPT